MPPTEYAPTGYSLRWRLGGCVAFVVSGVVMVLFPHAFERRYIPAPDIVVSFKSVPGACADPEICGIEVADSDLQQGQGIHGTLSRQDSHNFMAATGPDFRKGFVDPAPVSNADWAPTLARALGFDMPARGHATGRVMSEALAGGGAPPAAEHVVLRSAPAASGVATAPNAQTSDGWCHFDSSGAPGRAIELKP